MLISMALLAAGMSDISVSGIVASKSGQRAATLVSEGKARAVSSGDRAFGCDVLGIGQDTVEIACGLEKRRLKLTASKIVSAEVPLAVAEPERPADVTLSRAELEARLDREMSRLMTETTLIPVTSRGKVAGFTLSRIPAGTILETLGLRAGDVLTSITDTPIDSFTTLVGLWPRLQLAGAVRAQVLRDGRPMDISVSIR
jgi:type II secretory pathway component PulC